MCAFERSEKGMDFIMNKRIYISRGIFKAYVKDIRKKQERYCVFLKLPELDKSITIDIHDTIFEAIGTSRFDKSLIKKMILEFPSYVNISNSNGYWKIENESQLFSDIISKII